MSGWQARYEILRGCVLELQRAGVVSTSCAGPPPFKVFTPKKNPNPSLQISESVKRETRLFEKQTTHDRFKGTSRVQGNAHHNVLRPCFGVEVAGHGMQFASEQSHFEMHL